MDHPNYAVIGHPIAHSRSPHIHTRFAALTGITLNYEAIEAPVGAFAATLRTLRLQGLKGCNVTLPFKPEALSLAELSSDRAQRAGAANTLGWSDQGRLWADNTDGAGLCRDLTERAGFPVAGRRLLILGAGGAVAGCLAPLLALRPAHVTLCNRSPEKLRPLLDRHQDLGVPLAVLPWGECPVHGFDGVLNGTSAALGGSAFSLPQGLWAKGAWALDMVYGPAAAAFLQAARDQGASTRDGLGMLVEQAALSFERWHGVRPDTNPVFNELRQIVPEA
ncbi:shikimate dehydrogenase [Inhella gelatinilytica]|uniref:Shikimate dehydrogenase (NADP(+)) n=1 Tax=Inhella gelatinilytica TaxID=2795030 RepID=A0A931J0D7_9BURK|nr:shikimate dehydrogenase [Inhella gelatinilytica]MBH9553223.1 shikimate dehydrogenase [Inhella gelatinilytica]